MKPILTPQQAVQWVQDGMTLCTGGFGGLCHPEALTSALEQRFLSTGAPRDLTLFFAAGQGDRKNRGLNHLAHEGLLKRVMGGHWGYAPKLQTLVLENKAEGYNFPQGVMAHMIRDCAGGRPGTLTHVGLGTFVDPRLQGGKINARTTEELVRLMELDGKEYLLYPSIPLDIAFVRATTADSQGNASLEREAAVLETLSIMQAAKNSGGRVILQVERLVEPGAVPPRACRFPGHLVDAIVVAAPEEHEMLLGHAYNPGITGESRVPVDSLPPMELNERKVIARRCFMEARPGDVTNLGIGIPEGVAAVAAERGEESLILSLESGPVGGIPQGGLAFGACLNFDSLLDTPSQFDFYDGGGLDLAVLGLAELDRCGNVNVSRFGPRLPGCGGFINISQNARKMVFCGTFTAGGLETSVADGKLTIVTEGRIKKFRREVEQITFSAEYAVKDGRKALYVTERAVFELCGQGLRLIEIAPGIDLERDVLGQMEFTPLIAEDLKPMASWIFHEAR